jgi:hypothetical protein
MHALQAVATDNRGATNTSRCECDDQQYAADVALVNPTNGAVFAQGGVITLIAAANDPDGTNLVVQFFAGTNLLVQVTNGPYNFNWTNAVPVTTRFRQSQLTRMAAVATSAVVNVDGEYESDFQRCPSRPRRTAAVYFAPTNILITVTATDPDGPVAEVDLFADTSSWLEQQIVL